VRRLALIVAVALAIAANLQRLAGAPTPIYVALWFDTEDYILPQDDDATKRLAETLTRLGVRATFKVVGEKARVLERRRRGDVIAALKQHDIGYHSDTHSQQPTIAVYLQNAGWDEGVAEVRRRETQGFRDVARIFGVTPVAYGQPGSAWAPQVYPVLRDLGVKVYLDEADHVGVDDQPFYYGGLLNVFRMRSNLTRMALDGRASLAEGEAAFTKVASALRARGGGTISIYYHPNEWVQTEFWDAVNFSRGANPPRDQWKRPGTRPAQETEKAFADFEEYIRFIRVQEGVRFVTATELASLYADGAMTRTSGGNQVAAIARDVQSEITFRKGDRHTLSPADQFSLLTTAAAALVDRGAVVGDVRVTSLDGPERAFTPATSGLRSERYEWRAFARVVQNVAAYCTERRRIPDEVWIGAENLSPADFLATLGGAMEETIAARRIPAQVERRRGRFTADRYVAEDSVQLWSWPIFPEGFHAPQIMELARLQAWTLKPAMLKR
jgi:peptidoglycan/xylan/chitin deacetylase (PgdA/CDA1 family)